MMNWLIFYKLKKKKIYLIFVSWEASSYLRSTYLSWNRILYDMQEEEECIGTGVIDEVQSVGEDGNVAVPLLTRP